MERGISVEPPRIALIGLGVVITVFLTAACSYSPSESFQGTELTSANPAAPFELTDQFGRSVSLSAFDDRVVLLTFLYTNCPDVCPITTSQLRDAHEMLSENEDIDDIAFVAISVDPDRDTIESARDYSEKWDMTENWSYLVGTESELRPVWKSYYIDPAITKRSEEADEVQHQPENEIPERRGGVDGLREEILERYLIIHSAPVYLIDRQGKMRVVFTLPFDTEALVHDVRLLAN